MARRRASLPPVPLAPAQRPNVNSSSALYIARVANVGWKCLNPCPVKLRMVASSSGVELTKLWPRMMDLLRYKSRPGAIGPNAQASASANPQR